MSETYDKLAKEIEANGNIMTVEMGRLRDCHGAGKLGVNVVSNIQEELDARGIGHYPVELGYNQWEKAKLFKKGTAVANLVGSVLKLDDESNAYLRSVSNDKLAKRWKKIKELVEDDS